MRIKWNGSRFTTISQLSVPGSRALENAFEFVTSVSYTVKIQFVATRSFSTELRCRVFRRCCVTQARARPMLMGSLERPGEFRPHGCRTAGLPARGRNLLLTCAAAPHGFSPSPSNTGGPDAQICGERIDGGSFGAVRGNDDHCASR